MSANNWRQCPKCLVRAREKKAAKEKEARKVYGKVSPEEYAALVAEAESPVRMDDNLREDWEIGTSEAGKFRVSYRGSCLACDYEFSFKHEAQTL